MSEITKDITKLSEDLCKEAIQKTDKRETHKAYDTTGYGYQWIVDRFNSVLGEKWGVSFEVLKEITGNYPDKTYNNKTVPGKTYYEITVKVTIWVNDKDHDRSCAGGHKAIAYADAMKGAITNGFKKTAAFWGVGAKAFRGEIDDDLYLPEGENNKKEPPELPTIDSIKHSINELINCYSDEERIAAIAQLKKCKTREDYISEKDRIEKKHLIQDTLF